MMPRNRVLLLALLALAVPPFALGGEQAPGVAQPLSVSASLGSCGLAGTSIVCQIDASWSTVEGAEYYTVSVTGPDGSVVDYGESQGTGTSLFVPYVGPGSYNVRVAAWGMPPNENEPEVIVEAAAMSTPNESQRPAGKADDGNPGPETSQPPVHGGDSGHVPVDPAPEEPPVVTEPPTCNEEPGDPPAPDPGETPPTDGDPPPAAAAPQAEAPQPAPEPAPAPPCA